MPLVQLQGVTVAFGGPPVLDAVDLVLERGERLGLLGRNGAGKSTLLRVLKGAQEPDGGRVIREGGARVAALEQQVPEGLTGAVADVVAARAGAMVGRGVERLAVEKAVTRCGLDEAADVATLSAGLKRRVLLAAALATEPDLLLLDEPTNHLDIASIEWLEGFLLRERPTLLFVTHDRALLRRLATGILELDRGRLLRHEADYDRYLASREARLEEEARAAGLADKRLAEEEAWIREGVRERRKRNQGRVARLEALREARRGRRETQGRVQLERVRAPGSGRLVLRTRGLSFAWGSQPVVRDLDLDVERGDRVAIVGPNGSGKTTLLRLLLGELEPDEGTVEHGTRLEIATFDQLHRSLDEEATPEQVVGRGRPFVTVGGRERHVLGYLRDFLFTSDMARHPVRLLSGGERNRLLLARVIATEANVLVLDEPTNDLDVETLEALEAWLDAFEGTILVVSHDRELLDHVATTTLVLEGGGRVREIVGGWEQVAAWRARQAEAASAARSRPERPSRPAPRAPARLDRRERAELDALPARIEALEAERAEHHEAMEDPAFFRQEGERIAEAQRRLAALEEAIEAHYGRWEALEARRRGEASSPD